MDLEHFIRDHRPHGTLTANATPPAWNGYLLTVACPCGVVFERCLRLVEESDILYGDDGLVGEGLEQRDLFVGERNRFRAPEVDRAQCHAFTQEWHAQRSPGAHLPGSGATFGKLFGLRLQIDDVNGPSVQDRDEALASLAKAEAQLLASQPGPASPKVQQEFQRHVERALYLIDRAMEQIEAAKDAVNNP